MGADLYMVKGYHEHAAKLRPAFDAAVKARNDLPKNAAPEAKARAQAKVDRVYKRMYPEHLYFRDSYNDSSVAWRLGFSWWTDVIPKLGKGGVLSKKQCAALAERLERTKLEPVTADFAKGWGASPAKVNAYFTKKRARLIRFLKLGAESRGIECSL